jgi:hypothetical protein
LAHWLFIFLGDAMTTDQLRSELPAVAFDYTALARAKVIHAISVGMSGKVWVIGDGANASYEYVIRPDSGFSGESRPLEHSNAGYGCAASALRDGLIRALG